MMTTSWTYEGYWNAVLGANRDAAGVVEEFGLSGTRQGVSEWLGAAEAEAARVGGVDARAVWGADFHERALDELCAAAESAVAL